MEMNAAAIWINDTFRMFDEEIATMVHRLYHLAGDFFTPFFEGVSLFGGMGGAFLILLSVLLALYKPTRRLGTSMCLGLAIGALITNVLLKILIARQRPYIDQASVFYQYWLLVEQHTESDKSFPSGHVTATFASMTPVIILGKPIYKVLALCFAVLMMISRVYLMVHFPSDVLAGMVVGIFAGCMGVLIASKLPYKWYDWELKSKKAA